MFRTLSRKMKNRKGFTLIELIVVIAILAILALIAIPRLAGYRDTAQTSADARTLDTIEKSINIAAAGDRLGAGTVIATPAAGTGVIAWTGTATIGASNPAAITTIDGVMDDLMGDVTLQSITTAQTWTISAGGDVTGP